ncbi:BON domain-containing protein [Variovorax dokdonensis]|uniref:BON domain-containing protein n=1 Tax=Variovorax dokdonensis TaxID=344883 RepID=A0ABT7N6Y9_9BURK|nr:BON domain-containing protein [Variovorax dokdonensis]MDM0043711.1 BON domain-containing protein [Variovorax dokdonensis]
MPRYPFAGMSFRRAGCAVALAGLSLAIVGCDNADNRTAGQKLDDTIARTEKAADEVADKTARIASEAKQHVENSNLPERMADAARDAGKAVAKATDDATITASVNADLAKDPQLSALRIDVDTNAGKVTLSGPAPTAQAKERAEQIARNVEGVSSVDNRLEVKSM